VAKQAFGGLPVVGKAHAQNETVSAAKPAPYHSVDRVRSDPARAEEASLLSAYASDPQHWLLPTPILSRPRVLSGLCGVDQECGQDDRAFIEERRHASTGTMQPESIDDARALLPPFSDGSLEPFRATHARTERCIQRR